MTSHTANLNGVRSRTAPGAPASGTAGVELSLKRAGSEISAPFIFALVSAFASFGVTSVYFAVRHTAVVKLIG
jgi:hypothetical protein